MSNYLAHLDYEYRSLLDEDEMKLDNYFRQERRLRDAAKILADAEAAVAVAEEYYNHVREDVRDAHTKRMSIRKRLGEVEEEYFTSAEAHEDWH